MSAINQIQEEQKLLSEAFKAWGETYQITYPPPVLEEHENIDDTWWDETKRFWVPILGLLAFFVASRTGWGIYLVNKEEGFIGIAAVIVALAGVGGVEGFLIMFGLHRPRKLDMTRLEAVLDMATSWIAVIIGIIVSATSGFEISRNAAEQISQLTDLATGVILAYSLGIGMTFVLYGVSEFIGRRKWVGEHLPAIRKQEHRIALAKYLQTKQDEWRKSSVYLTISSDREVKRRQAEFDVSKATVGRSKVIRARVEQDVNAIGRASLSPNTSVKPSVKPSLKPVESMRRGYKTDLVHKYMDENYTPDNEPTIETIQAWGLENGVTLSMGLVSNARASWHKEHNPFK